MRAGEKVSMPKDSTVHSHLAMNSSVPGSYTACSVDVGRAHVVDL